MAASGRAQLVVIGAGPGGYAAAFYGADLGMDVALIDEDPNPGGVCTWRGCIPSKALLHAAKLIEEARHGDALGIRFNAPAIDVDRLRAWKTGVVEKLTGALGMLAKRRKVRFVQGRAGFADARTLRIAVAGGKEESLAFEHAIIATGSTPATLRGAPQDPRVLDSTTALDLADVPKTMLVVGGGYIGLELGVVYAALGSEVTVVEMLPGLLPGADRDLAEVLAKQISKVVKTVKLETTVAEMKAASDGIHVRFEGAGAGEERYDKALVAIGRKPNSQIEGLQHTRVGVDERGFITVDAQRRTAEPFVFAIGDVAGEPMLAHKASHEARVAVDAIAGHKATFDPAAIPAVVFTDPEVAWAGLTEIDAKARGIEVQIAKFPWAASGRAVTLNRTDGLTKLIIEPKTGRILGVGLVGPGAGELIAEGVVAIEMAASAEDLKLSIHPHPTLSETLMEAAEVFFGQSSHLYRPKTRKA